MTDLKEIRSEYGAREASQLIAKTVDAYSKILQSTIAKDFSPSFELESSKYPLFRLLNTLSQQLKPPCKPKGLARLLSSKRKEYVQELAKYQSAESARLDKLRESEKQHNAAREAHLNRLLNIQKGYQSGESKDILNYYLLVFRSARIVPGLQPNFKLFLVPAEGHLLIEYTLLAQNQIPSVREYRYVKSRFMARAIPWKKAEIKSVYHNLICSTALAIVHIALKTDKVSHVRQVTINGYVDTVDPATGREIRPCILTLQAQRARFLTINLGRVDPVVCFQSLAGLFSPDAIAGKAIEPKSIDDSLKPLCIESTANKFL